MIEKELGQFIQKTDDERCNEIVVFDILYQGVLVKIDYAQKMFKTELKGPLLISEDVENSVVRTGPIASKHHI